MIKKISDTLKEQAGKAMDSVSGASGKLNELTTAGMEQARDAMSALTDKVNELKDQGMEKIKALTGAACNSKRSTVARTYRGNSAAEAGTMA